jgi:SAM-dependent methyltransferase
MPTPAAEPHEARHVAESFGADSEHYDRARPHYPQDLVDRIVAASPGPEVVDAGCGTGIVARQFQAAGCQVLGVEPDPRMAAFARHSGVEVEVAKFEDWEPAGRAFDAVVAGMAWHWIDPVAGAAKAAQALRPGGRLAVFWYVMEPSPDLSRAFREVYHRALPDVPALGSKAMPSLTEYSVLFTRAADGMRQAGGFSEPEQWRFDWQRPYTRDEWLELVQTFGGYSGFPPDRAQALLTGLGAAVDAVGGSFPLTFATVVVTATV